MPAYTETLTRLRRQEQEARGYATSSRWYTGLSNAISFLERAETDADPLSSFRDAWAAAYNLFMMYGGPGDDEFKRFNRWITEVKEIPEVRRLLQEASLVRFSQEVEKAKRALLYDTEKNRWREGYQHLEALGRQTTASIDRVIRYFLIIVRDIRNACGHPEFNPSSAATKKALASGTSYLIPIIAAAIRAMIERPVEGTTGRTTAYRSCLWPFLKNADSFFSDYYLERLFPDEELEAFPEEQARELLKSVARQFETHRSALLLADVEDTRQRWCVPVLFPTLGANVSEGVRIVAEDGLFEPSCVLRQGTSSDTPRDEYQGKEAGRDLACLIWVLPWRSSLDAVSTDSASGSMLAMEVVQRALTRSDVPWAVLTNGQQLRLLARGTAHKPRCFLEIDLAAVMDRRGDPEALRAWRYCLGLFTGSSFSDRDEQGRTRLDRVLSGSERHGKEIGDELKQNVFRALEELGDGFLHYLQTHQEELEEWRKSKASLLSTEAFLTSEQLLDDTYHESLSLMYRLLFLFYAESRNLLPMDYETYRETYSLEAIRDDIISVHDDPDLRRFFGQGDTDLWDRLTELYGFLNKGWLGVIPAYNGGLFDAERHEFLERFKVPNYFLAQAIDLLSRTQPRSGQSRGEGRKKVTYRDLDVRHLGSIYEGILEYAAHIADQELVVMKRGSGSSACEEYVTVSALQGNEQEQLRAWRQAVEEDRDNPQLPRGCKIGGVKKPGSYFLVCGGRESKRKSSGSYYTPDYIVQYIVENTLGPLVRGECRPQPEPLLEELKKAGAKEKPVPTGPLSSEEILELKILDPAMGSGHFLVAATEYLARAYGDALVREGKATGNIVSDEEFIRYKRMIAERCIYGVDLNPMAVELAKLSLWLFTMDPSRPLSFLDHHLKCGNSLVGAWIKDLGKLPELDRSGRPKKKQEVNGQGNLFEQQFRARVPLMIRDLFGIMKQETLTPDDIETKKVLDKAVEEMKRPFKNVADAWVATFFGEVVSDYDTLLSNVDLVRDRESKAATEYQFFHWELEFPEVWFQENGQRKSDLGFQCIIQNPPWGAAFDSLLKTYLQGIFSDFIVRIPNSFMYFGGHSIRLLSNTGCLGFILPDTILTQPETELLRSYLVNELDLRCVVNLGLGVFVQPDGSEPTAPSCILCNFRPKINKSIQVLDISYINKDDKLGQLRSRAPEVVSRETYLSLPGKRFLAADSLNEKLEIVRKAYKNRHMFSSIREDFSQDITTGGDYAFVIDETECKYDIESDISKRTLTGSYLYPFSIQKCPLKIIYTDSVFSPIKFPLAMKYLSKFKEELEKKVETRQGIRPWYSLHRARDESKLSGEKILIRQTGDRLVAALDKDGIYILDSIYFITVKNEFSKNYTLDIIEAFLNSSIWNFLYMVTTQEYGRVFSQVKAKNVDCLPVLQEEEMGNIRDILQKKMIGSLSNDWREELDRCISAAFGLTTVEHSYIQRMMGHG